MNKLTTSPEFSGDWEQVVAGDRAALDQLFSTWMPNVLQWCRRLGGPRVDPEQAAQEVFLVVLRKVHTVTEPGRFPSWLFSVTRRVLAQHRRRVWGKRWMGEVKVERAAAGDSPHQELERSRQIAALRRALESMPRGLREAVVLCDLEERTDVEAAGLLGLPVGTLKSRLRRGRARLKTLLTEHGEGP